MLKRCIVQECVNKVGTRAPLCDQCYMILCSGIVKKTKSFLRCIPWMRDKLITIKSYASSALPNDVTLTNILKDVEGNE